MPNKKQPICFRCAHRLACIFISRDRKRIEFDLCKKYEHTQAQEAIHRKLVSPHPFVINVREDDHECSDFYPKSTDPEYDAFKEQERRMLVDDLASSLTEEDITKLIEELGA